MKKTNFYIVLLLSIGILACSGESAEEKNRKVMHNAISEFVSPSLLDSVVITDTAMVDAVKNALLKLDSSDKTLDSLMMAIPEHIESAQQSLEKTEEDLANLTFAMLKPMMEQTIAMQKSNIAKYHQMLESLAKQKELNAIKRRFSNKAIANALENLAYYSVQGHMNDSYREYFVSPGGVVLNEKPKEE
jgi:hypothetical protein